MLEKKNNLESDIDAYSRNIFAISDVTVTILKELGRNTQVIAKPSGTTTNQSITLLRRSRRSSGKRRKSQRKIRRRR